MADAAGPWAQYVAPSSAPGPWAQYQGASGAAPAPAEVKGGVIDSFLRNMTNAATFNLADVASAAANATLPAVGDALDPAKPSHAATWGERYHENLSSLDKGLESDQERHPVASIAGTVAGGFANPVTRALPVAKTVGGAALEGFGVGAAFGVGDSIEKQQDALNSVVNTALSGFFGAGAGVALHGVGKLLQPAEKSAAAEMLNDEGVPTTIGQSTGGTAHRLEDSFTSVPILGDAIRGQQRTGILEFNRASYNRVLQPLGLQYGKDAPVGNDGIAKLGQLIGKAYDHAFEGAVITDEAALNEQVTNSIDDASNVLPGDRLRMLRKNVNRLITSKFDDSGELSGNALKQAKNWLAEQARSSSSATIDERNLAAAYGDVLDALKNSIKNEDPERGALIDAADNAYMRFLRVANAASSNNASAKEGVFTPNQLGTAIRTLENSARKIAFAKGVAPLQDLAQAGQQVLSPTVPDSGTAMRTIFQHPVSSLATSPIWLAGQGLYTNAGQHLAHALAFGAPAVRKAIAGYPAQLAPGAEAVAASRGPAVVEP